MMTNSINNLTNFLLSEEEEIISNLIEKNFFEKRISLETLSEKDLHYINSNLLLSNDSNFAYKGHDLLVKSVIDLYLKSRFEKDHIVLKDIFEISESLSLNFLSLATLADLPIILEELHIQFITSQFFVKGGKLKRKISKHHIKESGAVYTQKNITNEIVTNCLHLKNNDLKEIKCLDFAAGTGRFYIEALHVLNEKYNLSYADIICNNLFAIDIDATAINILRFKTLLYIDSMTPSVLNALKKNILCRNALIPNSTLFPENRLSLHLEKDFKEVMYSSGFDIVFSNPPYSLLKVNKKNEGQLNDYYSALQNKLQIEISFFRNSGFYSYSIEGMLNYYQLSIEMIIKLCKPLGQIGIICPSSIFADLTATKLRKYILNKNNLQSIKYFPEASCLFENVTQATVIFYMQKGGETDSINITNKKNSFKIKLQTIKDAFSTNEEIPLIEKEGWSILSKISRLKKLKETSFIRNRRGELDLTLFKSYITNKNTGWRLVRGNMITQDGIIDKNFEYVTIESFIEKKSTDFKTNDFNKKRLVCQQISNVDSIRRLKFVFCSENDILGNSCNYISSTRDSSDLKKLNYILNSYLLNWRFKITSSNNHINNYELDELPIVDLETIILSDFNTDIELTNKIICDKYGLNEDEVEYIFSQNTIKEPSVTYEKETI
jgi:Alw26I/Eco31I/Esp3I family type II restriction m6 adenine DNA methyltransferase